MIVSVSVWAKPPVTQPLQAVSEPNRPTRWCVPTVCAGPPALIRMVGRMPVPALTVADRADSLPALSTAVTW